MVSLKDYRGGASAAVAGTDTGDNVGYPCAGDTQINVFQSTGRGERGAWFRDREGNLLGIGQVIR
jgi:hypothetical protein